MSCGRFNGAGVGGGFSFSIEDNKSFAYLSCLISHSPDCFRRSNLVETFEVDVVDCAVVVVGGAIVVVCGYRTRINILQTNI